jgi:4-hydroxy-4-methyl-2-oxoglutarate aldolase
MSGDSGHISGDIVARLLPPAVTGLAPLTVARKIAGPVITVRLGPDKPAGGSVRHLGTAAIESASNGDIIVLEHSSGVECAGWGGVLSAGAKLNGVAGVIINGPARDIDEAREIGFPIYGPSTTARTARGRVYEQDFDCSIDIAGVAVGPGDYVLADSSGVVFVARDAAPDIVRRAERIAARERLMVEALQRGERITEIVGRDYEDMLGELD